MSVLPDVDVAIIGAGIAGLAMAAKLIEERQRVVILEKADEIGGVWRDNTYPGLRSVTPAHLYALSSSPNPYWSHTYARGDAIQDYLLAFTEQHDLRRRIEFGAWVQNGTFDPDRGVWDLVYSTDDGRVIPLSARTLITAVGQFNLPHLPMIEGLHTFEGRLIHTAAWPQSESFIGQRVGLIGAGVSAVQITPVLAQDADELTLFQHEHPVIRTVKNPPYADLTIDRFASNPQVLRAHRFYLEQRAAIARHREGIISSEYVKAIAAPNVRTVTSSIQAVTADGVITEDDTFTPLDALVLGTGFEPLGSLRYLNVTGVSGRSLPESVAGGFPAYLGMSMADFPNMFMLLGPYSNAARTSTTRVLEKQIDHVMKILRHRDAAGNHVVSVRPDLATSFAADMAQHQDAHISRTWHRWPTSARELFRLLDRSGAIDYIFSV